MQRLSTSRHKGEDPRSHTVVHTLLFAMYPKNVQLTIVCQNRCFCRVIAKPNSHQEPSRE